MRSLFLLLILPFTIGCATLDQLAGRLQPSVIDSAREAATAAIQTALAQGASPTEAAAAARTAATETIKTVANEEIRKNLEAILPALLEKLMAGNWVGAATGGAGGLTGIALLLWLLNRRKEIAGTLVPGGPGPPPGMILNPFTGVLQPATMPIGPPGWLPPTPAPAVAPVFSSPPTGAPT